MALISSSIKLKNVDGYVLIDRYMGIDKETVFRRSGEL